MSGITQLLIGRPFLFGFWTHQLTFQQLHIVPPIAMHSLEDDVFLIKNILLKKKLRDSAMAEICVFWDMIMLLAE